MQTVKYLYIASIMITTAIVYSLWVTRVRMPDYYKRYFLIKVLGFSGRKGE